MPSPSNEENHGHRGSCTAQAERRAACGDDGPPARLGLGRAQAHGPAAQQRDAIRALGLDALDAQTRQVVFFNTPDLALDKAGVVVRARRIHGRVGDSVIKLRPLDPEQVSKDVRRLSGFGVEVDAIPGGFVCSGRLKCDADSDETRKVLLVERPLRKLYTKEQRALTGRMLRRGSSWTISRSSARACTAFFVWLSDLLQADPGAARRAP
jgi:hypothetical protein